MEPFDDMQQTWKENAGRPAPSLDKKAISDALQMRTRRQRNIAMNYFWGSFFYQNLMYALAAHVIIRFWQETQVVVLCLAFVILYVPFTILLLKRYKSLNVYSLQASTSVSHNLQTYIDRQREILERFFRFKKRFEWVAIPLSCLFIVAVIFELYVDGGVLEHTVPAALVYVVVLAIFTVAILFENKKRFIEPLNQLKMISRDFRLQEI